MGKRKGGHSSNQMQTSSFSLAKPTRVRATLLRDFEIALKETDAKTCIET